MIQKFMTYKFNPLGGGIEKNTSKKNKNRYSLLFSIFSNWPNLTINKLLFVIIIIIIIISKYPLIFILYFYLCCVNKTSILTIHCQQKFNQTHRLKMYDKTTLRKKSFSITMLKMIYIYIYIFHFISLSTLFNIYQYYFYLKCKNNLLGIS